MNKLQKQYPADSVRSKYYLCIVTKAGDEKFST